MVNEVCNGATVAVARNRLHDEVKRPLEIEPGWERPKARTRYSTRNGNSARCLERETAGQAPVPYAHGHAPTSAPKGGRHPPHHLDG